MKLFIDSAQMDEIKEIASYGLLDGVTTNPSLIKKAVEELKKQKKSIHMEQYIKELLMLMKGKSVSLEVTELSYTGMVEQGKKLYKMFNPVANNVYIKIPVNPSFDSKPSFDGIKAIKELSSLGIPINCTLIFTPEQALLAAKAGAKYVSPFAGRIDDYLREQHGEHFDKKDYFPAEGLRSENSVVSDHGVVSGVDLVRQTVEIFKRHEIHTEVLAASLRNARQVREMAIVGAHIATMPLGVFKDLLSHYKTQEGMKLFTADIVPEYTNITKETP